VDGVLLGSGGWIPTSRRETCSALLRAGRRLLLVDAGTGLRRLVEDADLVGDAERIDLVLTHFHLDHVIGLSYLPALPLQPVVWGPGKLLANASTRSILDRLLGSPFFSAPMESIAADVREIDADGLDLGPFELTIRVQERHTEPTLAFRVGDVLTYCTDTGPDPGTVTFASGSRALLHEAWHTGDPGAEPFHTSARDAAEIARDAGVERLTLIHVNPVGVADSDLLAAAVEVFPRTEVGVDLTSLPLS
jgi:ribonuclease BN (tRNA processing enzyme)